MNDVILNKCIKGIFTWHTVYQELFYSRIRKELFSNYTKKFVQYLNAMCICVLTTKIRAIGTFIYNTVHSIQHGITNF